MKDEDLRNICLPESLKPIPQQGSSGSEKIKMLWMGVK